MELWHLDLKTAALVNLFCSALVLIPGAVVSCFFKPRVFDRHPHAARTFGFWLAQWFAVILVWAVYQLSHGPSPVVLACADLCVVCALGLFWSYRDADSFSWNDTARRAGGIYAGLLLWNLVFAALLPDKLAIWVLPSEIGSMIACALLAWVFFKRYGPQAIPLAGVTIPIYAFLQAPTYASVFVEGEHPDDVGWIVALAVCKLLYGLTFYTLFFSPAQTDAQVRLPRLTFTLNEPVVTSVRWASGVVGAAILSSVANFVAHRIAVLMGGS